MLPTNRLPNNVLQPPQASQTAVDFLSFKLHVSQLINFYAHLQKRFPDYVPFMKIISHNARALEQWLTLPEAAQFCSGTEAVTHYATIIQTIVASDDTKRPEDYCILNFAAHLGHSGVVAHMLEEGAEANITEKNGSTPLHSAAKAGHVEAARLLIRAGALLNRNDEALFTHTAVVNMLIDEGALQKKDFPNILSIAAHQGNIDTVELLIGRGARLNTQNAHHKTALMIAAERGHMTIVHALINAQANLVITDREGQTALHLATAENHVGVVHVLLQARAKLKLSHQELSEAMLIAAYHGHAHLIPAFVLAGANPNAVNESGGTCLLSVAGKKQPELVNALLDAGANPNTANAQGFTPLMEAAFNSDRRAIDYLLRAGARINTQNSYGSTALMWAVEKGDEATVNTLIGAGADLTLINARGETALRCAQRFEQPQLLPILKQGIIQQFYRQLLDCRPDEVEAIIVAHKRAGVSKGDICRFMLASETDFDSKIRLLQYALARNAQGRPSNGLSKFMHHSQGRGFQTFFYREPSYAVSRIKTELYNFRRKRLDEWLTPHHSSCNFEDYPSFSLSKGCNIMAGNQKPIPILAGTTAEQIIFTRQLERQLEKVRDEKAKAIKAEIILTLANQRIAGEVVDAETTGNEKVKEYKLAIDRAALGRPDIDAADASAAFEQIWNNLNLDKGPKTSHMDIIQALKDYFSSELQSRLSAQNGEVQSQLDALKKEKPKDRIVKQVKIRASARAGRAKIVREIKDAYYKARNEYFMALKASHEATQNALTETQEAQEALDKKKRYELAKEKKRLENEIANKKLQQKLLPALLGNARLYSFASGFFTGGSIYLLGMLLIGLLPAIPILPFILEGLVIVIAALMFYYSARINWLSIMVEAVSLIVNLFFNPAHAELGILKRIGLWFKQSEFSFKALWNTAKGSLNTLAAAGIGLLVVSGTVSLLGVFLGWIPMGASVGALSMIAVGPIPFFVVGFALLAVMGLIYFVISNLSLIEITNGEFKHDEHIKTQEQLRLIDQTSAFALHKRFGFNFSLAVIGIGATMAGAHAMLTAMLPATLAVAGLALSMQFILVPLGIGLVVGLSHFYFTRGHGSTEKLLTDSIGLTKNAKTGAFDILSAGADVSGLDIPDFKAEANRPPSSNNPFKWLWHKFFNTTEDNSETARIINAAGQGGPAIQGAIPMLIASCGNIAGNVLGLIPGVGAAFGSYNANSVGMRKLKTKITEIEFLQRDLLILDKASTDEVKKTPEYELGEAAAEAKIYAEGRKRQLDRGVDHYGIKTDLLPGVNPYSGEIKVEAAETMAKQLDDYALNFQAVDKPLSFLYQPVRDKAKVIGGDQRLAPAFNPLSEGGLGKIAAKAESAMRSTASA